MRCEGRVAACTRDSSGSQSSPPRLRSPSDSETSGMDWDATTWERFERALTEYRDKEFRGRSGISGENAYLAIVRELSGVPPAELVHHVDSLVLFLNRWNCRLPTKTSETRLALQGWLGPRAGGARSAQHGDVVRPGSPDAPGRVRPALRIAHRVAGLEEQRAHTDDGRRRRLEDPPRHRDATLRHVGQGDQAWRVGLRRVHGRHARVRAPSPRPTRARRGARRHRGVPPGALGYPVRKPLAKYIDEYNWWVAWGLGAQDARGP